MNTRSSEASDKVSIIEQVRNLPLEDRAKIVSALLSAKHQQYQSDISTAHPEEIKSLTDAIATRIERG